MLQPIIALNFSYLISEKTWDFSHSSLIAQKVTIWHISLVICHFLHLEKFWHPSSCPINFRFFWNEAVCTQRDRFINYTGSIYHQPLRSPCGNTGSLEVPSLPDARLLVKTPRQHYVQLLLSDFLLYFITADFKGHFYSIFCQNSPCRPQNRETLVCKYWGPGTQVPSDTLAGS